MIYALNLFNLLPGTENDYREYMKRAGRIIHAVGGQVLCAGHQPIRHVATDGIPRDRFIIVAFPSTDAFDAFHSKAEERGLHPLRLASTPDDIWTLFEPWDLQMWMG
jgi:uncharacterized protein (DUF1330 family)